MVPLDEGELHIGAIKNLGFRFRAVPVQTLSVFQPVFMAWSETSGSRTVILRSKSSLVIASEPHNAPDVVGGQQDEN